ncbi:MAG TPA: hypothetical protein VI653_08430 [Steroidobacteraceae bacterium]
MRKALTFFGTLIVALAVAQAQTPADAGASAPNIEPPARASAPVPKADVKKATSYIRRAWSNKALCWDTERCSAYFSSFGTALTFNDGTLVPLAHERRLSLSSHECIQHALAALHEGNRAMAVQWVMAAHLDDPLVRNWLADHPDAVLEVLRKFGN